jgi:hypothetical protein
VTANIIVHRQSEAISVPNQVIFQKDGQNWVYVKRDGAFEKQPVTVGMRSLTKSQLTSGVEAGDDIALVEPKLEGKS